MNILIPMAAFCFGWVLIEIFAAFSNCRMPLMLNVMLGFVYCIAAIYFVP